MKSILLRISVLIIITGLLTDCKKPEAEKETATDPYTYSGDLTTSEDISLATYAITDIDMMVAFLGENMIYNHFYLQVQGTTGTVTAIRDSAARMMMLAFNKSHCKDGKTRSGSMFFHYDANATSKHYRDFGYSGKLNFSEFIVDDWKIELYDPAVPATITNKVNSSAYDPRSTNLTWEISGKFRLINVIDYNHRIVWDGKLTKTLTNTSDPAVFATNKQTPINWQLGKVSYHGNGSGLTTGSVPFTFEINVADPIKRDFTCSFAPPATTNVTQFHPFISGVTTATISNFHPRTINFGPNATCDNSGTISFKDETHPVTFK